MVLLGTLRLNEEGGNPKGERNGKGAVSEGMFEEKGRILMRRAMILMCMVFALAAFVGCASRGRRVPLDVEAVPTHDFNATDLQRVAEESVDKLLAMNVLPANPKPFVYVATVRNLTDEHINSEIIAEAIAVRLSESGKVRLSGMPKELEEAVKQLEFQRGAFINPGTAQKVGRMEASAYFLQGELSNLAVKAGWKKGQFFQFTLTLVHIETLEVWKSQVKIQKVSKKGLFGW